MKNKPRIICVMIILIAVIGVSLTYLLQPTNAPVSQEASVSKPENTQPIDQNQMVTVKLKVSL